MNLTNQLYDYLYDCGAALVGVADMSMDKNSIYPHLHIVFKRKTGIFQWLINSKSI